MSNYTGDIVIGTCVRVARENKNLSRAELADLLGRPYVYVQQIETGVRLPTVLGIIDLSRILGVTTDSLLIG